MKSRKNPEKLNSKKHLQNRIKGWLPKEPKLHNQSRPVQTPTIQKPLPKKKLTDLWGIIIITLVGTFLILSESVGFSFVQIILIIVIVAFAIPLLLFRRRSNRAFYRFLKYSIIFISAFALCFNSVGYYLFETSGYPPTYVPQLTYPNILNASLTQYFQTVQQSQSFRFLQTEHFETVSFFGLVIRASDVSNPSVQGWLMWHFYATDTNNYITMGSTAVEPYYIASGNPFNNSPLPQNYPSTQAIKENFEQIDTLGLNWFQNRAIEIYQNQTGTKPEINGLWVEISFHNQDNYQGMTIHLTAVNNLVNVTNPTVFKAEFQPNGTLLSYT